METLQAANSAKQQYRQQKPTFLKLVNENEKLQEELKRKQKQLLKTNLDKYFLFERLLSYEKPPPRKYTKQNKNKPLPGSDTVSADDPSSQNEMSMATPPKISKKLQKHKPPKRDIVENEEHLEVEVDTEEDNDNVSGMSLLKQQPSAFLDAQQKEQKSHERKKYKKRRKSAQHTDEKSQTTSSLLGTQIVPGGTSLLLSSFSAQPPSKG
jgi:hypothetical protein